MNDQQAAEYMAGIESATQAACWAIPLVAIETEIDIHEGLPISGDHRPRHGRLYARDER